ncbi:putative membrane protein [Aedoeadaptatus coxii]|uniref:Putative membrane protein n=2 Tax=Aedoeadaptatus coxii TaxID=755172 RepID=A0A134AF21_9FIRM|nr:putative membrane protein [Peptoniphilus coxii]
MMLWGTAIPLIKSTYVELAIGREDTGLKILLAGIRFFLAGLMTFTYFKIRNKGHRIDYKKINLKFIVILALIQTSLQYIFYYIGLSHVAGVKSSIIQSTNAFIVVLISAVLLPDEKVNPNIILALILGTLGIFITNYTGESLSGSLRFSGEGFILIATFFNALASVMLRKYGKGENPFVVTSFQFILGSLLLIVLGIALTGGFLALTPKGMVMILYGSFISACAFSIWTWVLQQYSANEFGVYKLFIPIFGSLFSVLALGEAFTVNMAAGLALVLLGSLILNKKQLSFGN